MGKLGLLYIQLCVPHKLHLNSCLHRRFTWKYGSCRRLIAEEEATEGLHMLLFIFYGTLAPKERQSDIFLSGCKWDWRKLRFACKRHAKTFSVYSDGRFNLSHKFPLTWPFWINPLLKNPFGSWTHGNHTPCTKQGWNKYAVTTDKLVRMVRTVFFTVD